MRTLVWFRGKDLRLSDHRPLASALEGGEVVLLFVLDPFFFAPARAREMPSRARFLLGSLAALRDDVAARGGKLFVVPGKSVEVVPRLAAALRVDRVVAQRWTEPFGRERDRRVAEAMAAPLELMGGELALDATYDLVSGSGGPYRVYTPFSRAWGKLWSPPRPIPAPKRLPPPPADVAAAGVVEAPVPTPEELGIVQDARILPAGEESARRRVRAFFDGPGARYHELRDRMGEAGTSRLSQDLKFGLVSPRALVESAARRLEGEAGERFRAELVWREFAHHLLYTEPTLLERPFRREFEGFPWGNDAARWDAWVHGRTGYPVVDASARQLLGEGFVHNRARMISASFLTKHLLVDFRRGEAHYMKHLTDGDWAQNDAGWQWSTGCGCDAQPYFRVFNPVSQGERFDPDGAYVRRWVPELAAMPAKYIHKPWEAPAAVLAQAGVTLGKTYPRPVVDLDEGRKRFLALAGEHIGAAKAARA
jgi:deoxyribodipyrimidine photo-lyase